MKKLLLSLAVAGCSLAQAQSVTSYFQLQLDGKPFLTADGKEINFGSQADCAPAVKTLGGHPAVKAKGANAVFGCEFLVKYIPAAVVPPVVTPPVVIPPVVAPPVVSGRGMTAGCEAVVAADLKLIEGAANPAIPVLAKPAKGIAVREPAFGTCLVRATDMAADAERKGDFVRNDYSRRQAFNADSSRYVAYELNGSWLLYDAKTMAKIKALSGPGSDAEFQWSATDPDVFYYTGTNGYGLALNEQTISTGRDRVVGDFAARVKAKWPTAYYASTKSEGSPSADGRYWCFMVDDVNWRGFGLFTWDKQTDTIIAMLDHPNGERPDSVSMSPSGDSCVWYGTPVKTFSRDLKTSKDIGAAEHSDLAMDADGRDVLVSVDYSSAGNGQVFATDLKTGIRKIVIPTMYERGTATALHISGRAFRKPGWFLLSTYADYDTAVPPVGRQWMHRKIMAVEMKTGRVLHLAHTRVKTPSDEFQYWAEPHATVNRDFTRVLFSSNWDIDSAYDIEAFMIQLPVGTVK